MYEKETEKQKTFDEGPSERHIEVEEESKVSSESFINKLKDCRTEQEKITLAFENKDGEEINWVPQGEPLNEFNTPNLFSACFPDLFHNGKGDPTSRDYVDESKLTWSKKIKHLMYFAFQNEDGSYTHPCENHALFAYASLNIKQRHEILRCSKVFLNNADRYKGMTIADLKEAFKGVDGLNLMKSLNHYTKSVAGSAGFWNELRKELEAAIEGKRAPTLFVTWSAADTHWKQLFRVLTGKDGIPSPTQRYKLLNEHPLICGDFFKRRFTKFFDKLKSILDIEDWWWRYEFQGRGSFHVHALLWLKNDPGIVDLVKTALKGHTADLTLSESTTDNGEDTLTEEEKKKLLTLVEEGIEAKAIVEQYYDWIITAKNPLGEPPTKENWPKPDVHPCCHDLRDIPKEELKQDYIDVSNKTLSHQCRPGYCLKSKLVEGKVKHFCRFGADEWKIQSESSLIFEARQLSKDRTKYVAKIIPSRNDTKMTEHNRFILQHWRANINVQLCLDVNAVVKYTSKYVAKSEKKTQEIKDVMKNLVDYMDEDTTSASAMTMLMMKRAAQRDYRKPEVCHYATEGKSRGSSFKVRKINLNPEYSSSCELKLNSNGNLIQVNDYLNWYINVQRRTNFNI